MGSIKELLIEQEVTIGMIERLREEARSFDEADITAIKLESRLKMLSAHWSLVVLTHNKIERCAKTAHQDLDYFKNDEFIAAEAIYLAALDRLQELLSGVSGPPAAPADDREHREGNGVSVSIKLPSIEVPQFDGNPSKWVSFRDLFESLIVENLSLTNTQRLQYLKAYVTGEAALLIQHVKIADENYAGAWQILKDEYGNERDIIHNHIQAFAELPVLKSEAAKEMKELRDVVSSSRKALQNLGRPVDSWDDLLVYIVAKKFSPRTWQAWNLFLGGSTDYPTYARLHEFLTLRIRGMARTPSLDVGTSKVSSPSFNQKIRNRASVNHVTGNKKCLVCSGMHSLSYCATFKNFPVEKRHEIARQARVCFNCLNPGHFPMKCTSQSRCATCKRNHNTLLHRDNLTEFKESTHSSITNSAPGSFNPETLANKETLPGTSNSFSVNAPPFQSSTMHVSAIQPAKVLLATAWVVLRTREGREFKVRALLDQGSSYSFISESLAQRLRTKRQRVHMTVTGFGDQYSGSVKSQVELTLAPCNTDGPTFPLNAYVFPKITAYAASTVYPLQKWPHLKDLVLADSDLTKRQPIHVLIGADLYGALLLNDIRHGPLGSPTAQLTIFGWIISGPTGVLQSSHTICNPVMHCVVDNDTDALLQKFWEVENMPDQVHMSNEDKKCEEHFVRTHSRTADGRYVVRFPFKNGPPIDIGQSLNTAVSLHQKLIKRLDRDPSLATSYDDFWREYQALGHMAALSPSSQSLFNPVYLPHHPVLREGSTTTSLRVVFNASSRTNNGTSLNDHLMSGPKLQGDLVAIMLRWRQHRYVYSADIAKMFRHILMHPDDMDFQRILWRGVIYRLLTVTYGTASAPFLALRVLKQLAHDEGSHFPNGAEVLRHAFYVDEAFFGADDISALKMARSELNQLLARGGFRLRKWVSNASELLEDIDPTDHGLAFDHPIDDTESLKVLGLIWMPTKDVFKFKVSSVDSSKPTKRTILSFIARLYDPLGWAAPIVITAKIIMQDLWLLKIDWDDPVPEPLASQWENYLAEFSQLSELDIPRWTGRHSSNLSVELHGFADASSRAYAASVYLKVQQQDHTFQIHLLVAKAKVAPLKTLSIPRLELCGAVLLTKLLSYVRRALGLERIPVYGWLDSTVALAWIRQFPGKWKPFVANRVSEIQTLIPELHWKHVASGSNPADCASRGISVAQYIPHALWWSGPAWLRFSSDAWPVDEGHVTLSPLAEDTIQSESHQRISCQHAVVQEEWDLPQKFSSWPRLLRVTAYIRRFVENSRCRARGKVLQVTPLSPAEVEEARRYWIRSVQRAKFPDEIRSLKRQASIRSLNPFLDQEGILRLGGRLQNAPLEYDEKHPIIIPRDRIADLIIAQSHTRALHGGTQLTLRVVRQSYWIIGARTSVKAHIHKCVRCVRERAATATQLMGNLPDARVRQSSPFTHTGVDYAGPMQVLPYVGRGVRARKYYVAVFICLATKAIHLEYVDDCATSGFLGALRRFVSRRGLPTDLYSDNGLNFQGSERELQQVFRSVCASVELRDYLLNDKIIWHFIPAAAPHFGGLWEAGVKSFKHHLKRVIGCHTLSQLEFSTLLCQIEACLNSRPLVALKDDPTDLEAITPGHFLIGRPLISVPERSHLDIKTSLLSRWQRVESMLEHVWRSWSHDYLHGLHQRTKWRKVVPEVRVAELVLLKNNLLPPSKWSLARVVATYPGADGHVRVVQVRTAQGLYKRPITQICRLPVEVPDDNVCN